MKIDSYKYKAQPIKILKVSKVFNPTNESTCLWNFGYQSNLQSDVPSLPVMNLNYKN